ncbi:MAG: HAD family hydrolase [Planctomycetota bacterium]|jgi:phosphoglycolate phosphatase-like HAD superfamily hydrolase
MADAASTDAILIFDLDGTLFHTETVTVPAAREAFAAHGLTPPPDAEICSFIGRTSAEYNTWLHSLCPPEQAEQVMETAVARELELIPRGGQLYPGIPEALAELRDTAAKKALCSNGSGRYVETVLAAHGIDAFFDRVRYRRPGDVSKPQMARELMERLRTDPRQPGVVVGDRHDDVEAAHANGLLAVGCVYGYGADGELDAADELVTVPAQLAAAVTRLLAGSGPQGIPAPG